MCGARRIGRNGEDLLAHRTTRLAAHRGGGVKERRNAIGRGGSSGSSGGFAGTGATRGDELQRGGIKFCFAAFATESVVQTFMFGARAIRLHGKNIATNRTRRLRTYGRRGCKCESYLRATAD